MDIYESGLVYLFSTCAPYFEFSDISFHYKIFEDRLFKTSRVPPGYCFAYHQRGQRCTVPRCGHSHKCERGHPVYSECKCPTQTSSPSGQIMEVTKFPIPIKVKVLEAKLHNYGDKNYLVRGFRKGFHLEFQGRRCSLRAKNGKSITTPTDTAQEKIRTELSLGRLSGSYNSPPFPQFTASPPALRPKKTSTKFRHLHNLSFSYDWQSVNFNIRESESRVTYQYSW